MPIAGAIVGLAGTAIAGASQARSARRARRQQANQNRYAQFLDIMRQIQTRNAISDINQQFDFGDEGQGTVLREQLEGLQQNIAEEQGAQARNRLLASAGLDRFRLSRAGIAGGSTNDLARNRLRQDLAVSRAQALGAGQSARDRAEQGLHNLRQGLTTRAQGGLFSTPSDVTLQQQGVFNAARQNVPGQAIGSTLSSLANTVAQSGDARELGRLGVSGLFGRQPVNSAQGSIS